jgi:hypothetical protein
VLEPLVSFAGPRVNLQPARGCVAATPAGARSDWCLQENIDRGPAIYAPGAGRVKLKLRMMLLRPDDTRTSNSRSICAGYRAARCSVVDFNRGHAAGRFADRPMA